MTLATVTITEYKRRYRKEVRELMFHSYRTHSHLDWYDTDQWLDAEEAPMRLAWAGGRLVGLMAASRPLHHTCWLRLAAVNDDLQPMPILSRLWDDLLYELRAMTVRQVALLVLRDWVVQYAKQLGFRYVEDIVTLRRHPNPIDPPNLGALEIHRAEEMDLDAITYIDQAAFAPPWQLSREEIRQAQRMAALCTIATLKSEIVGYQLSTIYFDGGHLARLAVLPDVQGHGVGKALVGHLLRAFQERGVASMTVNTQATNTRSQRLYQGFGFVRNGYDLPVWMIDI